MDRKVWAFALVSVAASLAVTDGTISHARVVLGGVANVPWRARGRRTSTPRLEATDGSFARAADIAVAGAQPLAHNGYKVPLARALVIRALDACVALSSPGQCLQSWASYLRYESPVREM